MSSSTFDSWVRFQPWRSLEKRRGEERDCMVSMGEKVRRETKEMDGEGWMEKEGREGSRGEEGLRRGGSIDLFDRGEESRRGRGRDSRRRRRRCRRVERVEVKRRWST